MKREYNISEDNPILKMNPYYYFPLTDNSQDVIKGLTPVKVGGTINYSESGARFNYNLRNFLAYKVAKNGYNSGFLKFIQTSRPINGHLFQLIDKTGLSRNPLMTGYITQNSGNLGYTIVNDYETNKNIKLNLEYSLSWSLQSNSVVAYINGERLMTNVTRASYIATYLYIGGNWRDYEGSGTRAFDGYIKDFALWNRTLSDKELLQLSMLEY